MNHVSGREIKPRRNPGIASRASAKRPTGLEQLSTGSAVYGTIDATATEQTGIRRIDDSVKAQGE